MLLPTPEWRAAYVRGDFGGLEQIQLYPPYEYESTYELYAHELYEDILDYCQRSSKGGC